MRPDMPDPTDPDMARFIGEAVGKAVAVAYRALLTPEPLPPQRVPRNEDPRLAGEAERCRREALEKRTPTPITSEESTVCLRTEREPESSDPPPSSQSTEEELSAGELQRLTKMADDDLEILEQRRLHKLSRKFKGPA